MSAMRNLNKQISHDSFQAAVAENTFFDDKLKDGTLV